MQKEFTSHIDYDRPAPGAKGSDWGKSDRRVIIEGTERKMLSTPRGRDVGVHKQSKSLKEDVPGGCIFSMDGIKFGLEVCLDHLQGRLVSAPDRAGVQIQLITSAGAWIEAMCRCPNAIIFNVDGGGNGSTALQDTRRTVPRIDPCGQLVVPANGAYFPGNGTLTFYDPIALP